MSDKYKVVKRSISQAAELRTRTGTGGDMDKGYIAGLNFALELIAAAEQGEKDATDLINSIYK